MNNRRNTVTAYLDRNLWATTTIVYSVFIALATAPIWMTALSVIARGN